MRYRITIVGIILVVSVLIRFFLLHTFMSNYKHGSAPYYGSAAIGLYKYGTLSVTDNEMDQIKKAENINGNYLEFDRSNDFRSSQITFLPAPAYIIYLLWKVFPVYNFSSLIYLQIIIESIAIILLYLLFYKVNKKMSWFVLLFLIFNLVSIKRTLMVGYDFWPQITYILSFYYLFKILEKNNLKDFIILALINSSAIWFREITICLIFVVPIFIFFINIRNKNIFKNNILKISIMVGIYILSLLFLSYYRETITGNARPTRSTFWHSYMVGIGQFSNPYDLIPVDTSPMNYALKNDTKLEGKNLDDVWQMTNEPNSEYEIFAKTKSIDFIKNYPHLFIRNSIYRTAIILSPLLYSDGDFLPEKYQKIFFVFGLIFLPVWFLGIYRIYKYNKILFYTIIILFANTIISFSWWYVVGRVIIPILFTHFIVYLFALKYIYDKFFKDKLEVYFKRNNKKQLVTDNTQNI